MSTPWDLPLTLRDKIAVTPAGCWIWTGATQREGYGRVKFDGRLELAHRAAYLALVGGIPDGRHLDHLCRVPRCVNPDHLEPVTQAENNRRAADAHLALPHFRCGHPRTEANTKHIRRQRGRDTTTCRTCHRISNARWRATRHAA